MDDRAASHAAQDVDRTLQHGDVISFGAARTRDRPHRFSSGSPEQLFRYDLREHSHTLSHERPIVLVCQSGKRSGMGTVILKQAGFTQVASLAGGMIRWHALGLPS